MNKPNDIEAAIEFIQRVNKEAYYDPQDTNHCETALSALEAQREKPKADFNDVKIDTVLDSLRDIVSGKIMTEQGLKDETDENFPFYQLSRRDCLLLLEHQRDAANVALSALEGLKR